MKTVVQRVKSARVLVDDRIIGEIETGLLALIGVGKDDTLKEVDFVADKIVNLRIFEDQSGKMNLSVLDIGGQVLAVPQFTLYGDVKKGRRPNFTEAALPELGKSLFDEIIRKITERGIKVNTGEFGAKMLVEISNDGPCTIIIDSE
ncbi:MAG: D-tyrosyl-tRNA(Tyr) deacylase [Syntrophomonadaceae bacterium]|nr:D-tyrosyl-tRNA(Tyr) deacylase [Syntrophomonadaceae bacterium]